MHLELKHVSSIKTYTDYGHEVEPIKDQKKVFLIILVKCNGQIKRNCLHPPYSLSRKWDSLNEINPQVEVRQLYNTCHAGMRLPLCNCLVTPLPEGTMTILKGSLGIITTLIRFLPLSYRKVLLDSYNCQASRLFNNSPQFISLQ